MQERWQPTSSLLVNHDTDLKNGKAGCVFYPKGKVWSNLTNICVHQSKQTMVAYLVRKVPEEIKDQVKESCIQVVRNCGDEINDLHGYAA